MDIRDFHMICSMLLEESKIKYYDFEKAQNIIDEWKTEGLDYVELGIGEDWVMTAAIVWQDGHYCDNLVKDKEIVGITGSTWGTPVIKLTFKSGHVMEYSCYYKTQNER